MADLPDRDEWERRLARANGRLGRQAFDELMELLGDPPDLSNVPPAFWQTLQEKQTLAVVPVLREVYMISAEQMLGATPVGVDWAIVNRHAIEWANRYGFELVQGITETTRQTLADAVGNFFSQGQTLGDLRGALEPAFGTVRADLIASTEITRAAVQGELDLVQELDAQGIRMAAVWQTSEDEAVCPICGPLQGTTEDVWGLPPPAHPRCRCWLNHELVAE
jgi:hypothetical protein